MSAAVIAQLNACAETPGMPPGADFLDALADPSENLIATEEDLTPTKLPEIGEEPAQESSAQAVDEGEISPAPSCDPDLWLYRDRTVGLLRRYLRLSIEVGRMPSLLGREFFRTRVTSYRAATFEDSVIFVHDVERSLEKLSEFDQQLIAKVVLQEYSQEEAGRQLGCGRRHAVRCFSEALDRATEIFLKRELLTRLPSTKPEPENSCQGGKNIEFPVSDSEQAKNKS
jgi:hypothetical protein